MQRARAPAISIKTKGFIRGRKMLLNPGMIPQILQQKEKAVVSQLFITTLNSKITPII